VNRTEKAAEIDALRQEFRQARNAFLVGFSGLTVPQVNDLRRKVRESSGSYRVVKNRLALRALEGTLLEPVAGRFQGPTGVAYNEGDPVALAKALSGFAKDNPGLSLRVAVVEGQQVVEDKGLQALAKLPSLPELQAQLLSLVQAPATKLVRLLSTPGTQTAQVLKARQEELAKSGG
jgi:large subunit ribosomal protein L10